MTATLLLKWKRSLIKSKMLNISEVEKIIGYNFKNSMLLVEAMTHPSYTLGESYQRLEFLGDSLLGFIVAEIIFRDESKDEGDLTKKRASIVSKEPLSRLIKQMGLLKYVVKGGGATLSEKNASDIFESLLGAIYLDGGLDEAKSFVIRTLLAKGVQKEKDSKSLVYEYCAKHKLDIDITYQKTREQPPLFKATLIIDGKIVTTGEGASQKKASASACDKYAKKLCIK